jgi:MFS family permease
LASFYYGYVITQIPGGWLSNRFGGRRVYGTAMAISGVATLLKPVGARTHVVLLYVLRIIVGLATVLIFTSTKYWPHDNWKRLKYSQVSWINIW